MGHHQKKYYPPSWEFYKEKRKSKQRSMLKQKMAENISKAGERKQNPDTQKPKDSK